MRFVCKLGLALCCLPMLMGAAVYRWVDESGVVNYTQLKPEGVDAELVSADTGRRITEAARPQPAAAADDGNDEQQLTENQERMLADLRAAESVRQQEIAKVREANCQQARDVLERLTSRGRIRVAGDDGVERVMPEEERQERISEAQRSVAANCAATASR
jgi:hypothetical protein